MPTIDSLKTDRIFKNAVPKLTKTQLSLLRDQIERDGILNPLIVWKRNGARYVIDGHHRLVCCKLLGIKNPPIIEKKFSDKNEALMFIYEFCAGQRNMPIFSLIEVAIKKHELRGRMNQAKMNQKGGTRVSIDTKVDVLTEISEDVGVGRSTVHRVRYLLEHGGKEMLESLQTGDLSVNEAFVRTRRLVELRKKRAEPSSPTTGPLPKDIKIICGDCREVYPRIAKTQDIDLVLTDPPYNIGMKGYDGYEDQMPDEEYIEMLRTFRGTPMAVILYPEQMFQYAAPAFGVPDEVLCWTYNSNTPRQFRLINVYGKQPDFDKAEQPFKNPSDKRIRELMRSGVQGAKSYDWINLNIVKNVSKSENDHPCPVPVELMEWLILLLTNEGDTIVDPFCGSASTMLAARNLGRKAIGIEMSKKYVALAKRRLREEPKAPGTELTHSAYVGDNAILFERLAELYLKEGDKIADITFDKGTFWRNIDVSQFDFHPSDLMTSAKRPYDFRKLPYGDSEFDVVVFDPPYAHNPGKSMVNDAYQNAETTKGFYHRDIIKLYRKGMMEAKRILKPGGLLMVKCQDEVESTRQRRSHIEVFDIAVKELGFEDQDCFVLVADRPVVQHKKQEHARKNHSFLWVFGKVGR